jgi:hypothetical protein
MHASNSAAEVPPDAARNRDTGIASYCRGPQHRDTASVCSGFFFCDLLVLHASWPDRAPAVVQHRPAPRPTETRTNLRARPCSEERAIVRITAHAGRRRAGRGPYGDCRYPYAV